MTTLYSTQMSAKHLKAVAQAAKAVNVEVTLALDANKDGKDHFRFWSKDAQKKCALVGHVLNWYEDAHGSARVRVPTANLFSLVNTFDRAANLAVDLLEDGDENSSLSLRFIDLETDEIRSMTVQEAGADDEPYAGKMGKGRPSCTVPSKLLAKVVGTYKRNSDVVSVDIDSAGLCVRYDARNGSDSWRYAAESVGEGSGKFSTVLLQAAASACKDVGRDVAITLSPKALRLGVTGEAIHCRVYVAANETI